MIKDFWKLCEVSDNMGSKSTLPCPLPSTTGHSEAHCPGLPRPHSLGLGSVFPQVLGEDAWCVRVCTGSARRFQLGGRSQKLRASKATHDINVSLVEPATGTPRDMDAL